MRQATLKDMVGQRIGRLLVIALSDDRSHRGAVWVCRCECGTVKPIDRRRLRVVRSCGCLKRERLVERMANPAFKAKALAAALSPEARKKAANNNRRPLSVRFERHVHPEPNSGCWLWAGAVNGDGYGLMMIDKGRRPATHVSLELDGRPKPFPGAMALHSCDNPPCVNPDHLRWGTAWDNAQDAVKRGRLKRPRKALGQ
jgi:hypothetical protein